MLEVNNLSKYFGKKKVLHSVSLRLDKKVYGLLGTNGAGKTTLIRCMVGLYEPQQGEVLFQQEPLDKSRDFYYAIGYLPQVFGMFRELALFEMMEYICSLKNLPKKQWDSEITQALKEVNLENKARKKIKSLSGGMVRRAGIAQAILGTPKLIILDEPTAGLDPGERARFKNMVREISKGRAVLISTHIVEDVDACCNSVIIIDKGRILFNGPCEELKNIALNKVYFVKENNLGSIVGENFILKISEMEDGIYHRVLAKERQNYQSEKPTLEDGYICLVEGLAL